jgi:hypothetical protein
MTSKLTVHLIVELRMEPIPAALTVYEFDPELRVVDARGHFLVQGRHIGLGGDTEIIWQWLAAHNQIWVGEGSPMMQQFTRQLVKERS